MWVHLQLENEFIELFVMNFSGINWDNKIKSVPKQTLAMNLE